MLLCLITVANILFWEHRLSIFCKTCYNHPFLKRYYLYFWRSLTGTHCVLTMYFRFIAGFFFFCFFVVAFLLSRVICIYLFYNANCSHLPNQMNCDWFKSTKKVLCLLKETNCSSDFNGACLFRKTICSKFCLMGTVFNARKHLQSFILSRRMHWFQKLCYSHPLFNPYGKMFSL